MNDGQLESLLLAADASADAAPVPTPGLADRARNAHAGRRQRTRRVQLAVALAGCYVAGMVTTWIASPFAGTGKVHAAGAPSNRSNPADVRAGGLAAAQGRHVAPQQDTRGHMPPKPSSVAVKSRYELLRQLGDESHHRGDLQSAIAFYGNALDVATEAEQQVSYQRDNWLLISLKKDHMASHNARTPGDSI